MLKIHNTIKDFSPSIWNRMVAKNYPFLQHAFLSAMESCHTLDAQSGWQPCYLGYYEKNKLMGVLPLYVKYNSWGEFVFDHVFAHAYEQFEIAYYPKLVNSIPFTPATGQRILRLNPDPLIGQNLIQGALKLMQDNELSSLHCLFAEPSDFAALQQPGAIQRYDCQYHWHNQNYHDFEDFLTQLTAKKRKNIRQERRKAKQHGLDILRLDGHTASEDDWRQFAHLFASIYQRKHGRPAFNARFFIKMAQAMPSQIHLVCAKYDNQMVSAALMYNNDDTLYGRHWGTLAEIDCLHFELCYYQGIELCIEKGLTTFDPGAQGEHKIARGFVPTLMRSLHYFHNTDLSQAIIHFCQREQQQVLAYIQQANQHVPYAKPELFIQNETTLK